MRYQITSVLHFGMFDTIIQFRAQALSRKAGPNGRRGQYGFGKTVLIAVDHRPARHIREALASGIRPIVEPESWQVFG